MLWSRRFWTWVAIGARNGNTRRTSRSAGSRVNGLPRTWRRRSEVHGLAVWGDIGARSAGIEQQTEVGWAGVHGAQQGEVGVGLSLLHELQGKKGLAIKHRQREIELTEKFHKEIARSVEAGDYDETMAASILATRDAMVENTMCPLASP